MLFIDILAAEYCGEKLADFFGITSPKYQYVINEYHRLRQEVCNIIFEYTLTVKKAFLEINFSRKMDKIFNFLVKKASCLGASSVLARSCNFDGSVKMLAW